MPNNLILHKTLLEIKKAIETVCNEYYWEDIVYAGIVGSSLITSKAHDIDIIVITTKIPEDPSLIHQHPYSFLVMNRTWLTYEKHNKQPVGLIPSILFKSLQLSKPVIGNIKDLAIPTITVNKTDWINLQMKKDRYRKTDKKNYLVALLFEHLLRLSPDLSMYSFDKYQMGENIGANELVNELLKYELSS